MRLIYLLLLGIYPFIGFGQSITQADSLFQARQYTQANEIYEGIYHAGKASPAMLLRMAFIQEGLGNYAQALYYLNHYYQLTTDREVLDKMREIASEKDLRGYEYSDMEFFRNFILKNKILIQVGLVALSLGLLTLVFFRKNKQSFPFGPLIGQTLLLFLLIMVSNNFFTKPKGIIGKDQTLLMSGPSAGAEPIEILGRGHKITILQEDETWARITWANQEGYVRTNRIKTF